MVGFYRTVFENHLISVHLLEIKKKDTIHTSHKSFAPPIEMRCGIRILLMRTWTCKCSQGIPVRYSRNLELRNWGITEILRDTYKKCIYVIIVRWCKMSSISRQLSGKELRCTAHPIGMNQKGAAPNQKNGITMLKFTTLEGVWNLLIVAVYIQRLNDESWSCSNKPRTVSQGGICGYVLQHGQAIEARPVRNCKKQVTMCSHFWLISLIGAMWEFASS